MELVTDINCEIAYALIVEHKHGENMEKTEIHALLRRVSEIL